MDFAAPLASKLRRRMVELVAYPARFDFGRLFSDSGRVLARAGLAILVGVLVLGVAPDIASSVGWWREPPGMADEVFRRTALTIILAKVAISLQLRRRFAAFVATVHRCRSSLAGTGARWQRRDPWYRGL